MSPELAARGHESAGNRGDNKGEKAVAPQRREARKSEE